MARVLLASDDLNARARVLAAAEPLRIEVVDAPPAAYRDRLAGADLLIIDLDGGREPALEELAAAMAAGEAPDEVVGFLSHVDGALARAAREAGCRAIARGRFWSTLPEILGALDPD